MAQSTTTDAPAYFETGPGIRTTIGLFNVLTGLMVAGIAGGFTTILLVPIIASAACALARVYIILLRIPTTQLLIRQSLTCSPILGGR